MKYSRLKVTSMALALGYFSFPAIAQIPAIEREALIALYNSTGGANWLNNSTWLGNEGTECTWYGVTCDLTGQHVTSIDLWNNGLSGNLPPELGNLSSLASLSLNSNSVGGAIPPEFGNLRSLEVLWLQSNEISGTIPPELENLDALRYLYLGGNSLSGEIPAEMGNLASVEYLGLGNNQLTGHIPPELGNLRTLKHLYLETNQLTGNIPAELGNLDDLEFLRIWSNPLTGTIPPELGDLSMLEHLTIAYTHIGGAIPPELGNLGSLKQLFLIGNDLSGQIPEELGNLTSLMSLRLHGNMLSGPIPSEIGNLNALEEAFLQSNQLAGEIPQELTALSSLSAGGLDLRWNALYSSDDTLIAFLNDKQNGGEWRGTQTVAPTNVLVECNNSSSAYISWDPISFTSNDGGYRVLVSLESGGPYTEAGMTATKNESGLSVGGLDFGLEYRFVVQTVTEPHPENQNTVESDVSVEVSQIIDCGTLYSLGVTKSGSGTGEVTSDKGGIDCGTACSADFLAGTTVTLTAVPDPPSRFSGWSGEGCSGSGQCTVTMNSPVTIDAKFVEPVVPEIERQALIALYNSTEGANWLDNTGWLGELGTECTWRGVACSEGHVHTLFLPDNHLSGSLPAELGNLSSLEYLGLSDNQLSGSIPTELGSLSDLQYLYLHRNQLSGGIPGELGNLPDLLILYLPSNQLSGNIPAELGELTNLEGLQLFDNQLSGGIPPELGNLSSLEWLDLSFNELSASIPPELGNLSNLKSLDLIRNRLSGSIPPELGNLSSLEWLHLASNQLSGNIPSELGNLSNLTELHLFSNQLTGEIPGELGNLSNLKRLRLEYNQLNGSIPAELGNLPNLEWLYLAFNQLSGDIPPELGNLSTSFRQLYLSYNQLSGEIPALLGNLSSLHQFVIAFNQLSGDIPRELGSLSSLAGMILSSNRLSGVIPRELGGLLNLKELKLNSNKLVGEIPAELGDLSTLTTGSGLDLRWNALNSSDDTLIAFLNDKQNGGDWRGTQTVAPTNVLVECDNSSSAYISWDPISFTSNDGGYRALVSLESGGPYTEAGMTATKNESGLSVGGLDFGLEYRFVVQTVTEPHPENQNTVESDVSVEVSQIIDCGTFYSLGVTKSGSGTGEVTSDKGGIECGTVCSADFLAGTTVTLTAVPDPPSRFSGWSGEGCSGTGQCTVTMNSPVTIDAMFVEPVLPEIERQALIALYNSTDGANWLDNTGWLGELGTECTWFGVACTDYSVTVLDLHYNQLVGVIPGELGNLPNLRELILNTNQLSGPIPQELGSLSSLERLYLGYNQLSGVIPIELGNLSNLKDLHLTYNQLSDSIPQELGSLSNLERLYLDTNQLSGSIPKELGSLSNIQYLDLKENKLTGVIPTELGKATNLKILSLESNQLSGSIPAELGNLSNVEILSLYKNDLSGTIPPELANLSNVQLLVLSHNQLSGEIPSGLGNLPNLFFLHLEHNQLSGTIPAQLGGLSALVNLYLGPNRLSGSIPRELGNLLNLKYLDVRSNQLSGPIPVELVSLTNLETPWTNIGYNALWTDDPVVQAFLASKDPDWDQTQTVAPRNVAASVPTSSSVVLEWTPIDYGGDAGIYAVFLDPAPPSVTIFHDGFEGGDTDWWRVGLPWVTTTDKTDTSVLVEGLEPGTTYDFVIRTITEPHVKNQNQVISDSSASVSETTAP